MIHRSVFTRCNLLLYLVAGVLAATSAGATVITPSPVPFSNPEQSLFGPGAVATFTDDNPAASPGDFTATIDWGDGSATTAGSIGSNSGAFVVLGSHTYDDEGTFTVTVTISDQPPGTGTATATSTATITEADVLTGTGLNFTALAGISVNPPVATFKDALTSADSTDFTATINWGDATTSAGAVSGTAGIFSVSGTHTYAAGGNYTVSITLTDDTPGTATATVTATASVQSGTFGVTGASFTIPEGQLFNGTVATFVDASAATPAQFTATINWGDTTTTAGTITGGPNSFTVTGSHTYADEGSFTTTVTIAGAASGSGTGTATVTESDNLSGTGLTIAAEEGTAFNGPVATFHDTYTGAAPDDFAATINWGDGATTAGTVSGGSGSFTVSGTHTYTSNAGSPYPVTVTLTDDPPGTATATAIGSATVSVPLAEVPTLDGRGLLGLAALLSLAGWMTLRRSRRASMARRD